MSAFRRMIMMAMLAVEELLSCWRHGDAWRHGEPW